MKKKLTVNALFAILSAAFILIIGCGGSGSDNPDKPEVKVVATNIVVPSSAEVTAGESLTFNLRGKTNFSADDQVILRSASNTDFVCPMVSFSDGSSLAIRLPDNIVSGSYKIYVAHGEVAGGLFFMQFDESLVFQQGYLHPLLVARGDY